MAWPFVMVLAVGVVVAIAVLAGTRRFLRQHRCPVTGAPVVLVRQEAVWDGRPVDVESCTAFTPPTAIRCDKACLHPVAARNTALGQVAHRCGAVPPTS